MDVTKPFIPELDLSSVSQLVELIDRYRASDLFFRGQSGAYPNVTTTLERMRVNEADLEELKDPESWALWPFKGDDPSHIGFGVLPEYEAQLLEDYKERARHFLTDLPDLDDTFFWLAIMQHHGAPTRLLDVTKSIFVALYFATAHADNHDGILYSFFDPNLVYNDGIFVIDQTKELIGNDCPSKMGYWRRQVERADKFLAKPAGGLGKGIWAIKNPRPSQRELAQQSRFLMPLDVSSSFEDNMYFLYQSMNPSWVLDTSLIADLSNDTYLKCPIIKFRIQRKNFRKIRVALQHMNITAGSLFPDFEGLNKLAGERVQRLKSFGNIN
jgi:hypothetical protein